MSGRENDSQVPILRWRPDLQRCPAMTMVLDARQTNILFSTTNKHFSTLPEMIDLVQKKGTA
jgi:hypothetical protein